MNFVLPNSWGWLLTYLPSSWWVFVWPIPVTIAWYTVVYLYYTRKEKV